MSRESTSIEFRVFLVTLLVLTSLSNSTGLDALEQARTLLIPGQIQTLSRPIWHGIPDLVQSGEVQHRQSGPNPMNRMRPAHLGQLNRAPAREAPVDSSARWITLNLNILSNLPVGDIFRSIRDSGDIRWSIITVVNPVHMPCTTQTLTCYSKQSAYSLNEHHAERAVVIVARINIILWTLCSYSKSSSFKPGWNLVAKH